MKEQIKQILIQNKDKLITGTYIANTLKITRSYVSKIINELILEGYNVEIKYRSGYIYKDDIKCLKLTLQELNNKEVKKLYILDKVDSTNTFLKKLATENKDELIIAIANEQTGGRGRLGRTFISNKGKGIYISFLFRPKFKLELSRRITSAVATAVSNSIDKIAMVKSKIKWVNDIYLNNKKLAGILTEGKSNFENGTMDYIIVGIGINVYHQEFPTNLDNIITTIEDETKQIISRNKLIIELINQVIYYYQNIEDNLHINDYRNKSLVINHNVELNIHGKVKYGKVIDIDDEGELIVNVDNNIEKIYSGEITKLRMQSK